MLNIKGVSKRMALDDSVPLVCNCTGGRIVYTAREHLSMARLPAGAGGAVTCWPSPPRRRRPAHAQKAEPVARRAASSLFTSNFM